MAIATSVPRAVFAADPAQSRGRRFAEPASPSRNDFRRDCDRIIHSAAFRRLAHKTQVFVYHEGDHYRTRLTHTLEVVQIARSLARALGLDEDLAEALALTHDVGHSPFGHAGERALEYCAKTFGGFDHNAQALRILSALERRYANFDGLNLTWETLEGLVKHNGPLTDRAGAPIGRYIGGGVPAPILSYARVHDLELWSHASAEAQVAAIADDIAYDAHDIDDGLRADLFALGDLSELPLVGDILLEIAEKYPRLDEARRPHETVRRVITRMIEDVTAESRRRLDALSARSPADVRYTANPVIAFSPSMQTADTAIKGFLYPRMYRHEWVMRVMNDAERIVRELYAHFIARPEALPEEWRAGTSDEASHARRAVDYIAGMTDRYALTEHRRWCKDTPDLH
jgi:dGTPase